MNCKNCGSSMVPGQTICSNCDYVNNDFETYNYNNGTNFNTHSQVENKLDSNSQNFHQQTYIYEQQNNVLNTNKQSYENIIDNSTYDTESKDKTKRKQNIMLKIASILALIAGIGMLISIGGTLLVKMGLGRFNINDLFAIIISIIMIISAFFISNFNIGKSSFYDNKIIFIVILGINFISGLIMGIYFLIFVFSLIGFIISCKNNKDS